MKQQKMNKRGDVQDIFFTIAMLFILGFCFIISYKVVKEVNTEIQASGAMSTTFKSRVSAVESRTVAIFDIGFLLILGILWIGMVFGAFMIETHPFFYIVILIVAIFIVGISGALANAYYAIHTEDSISTEASEFTIIPWVMQHYVLVATLMIFSVAIALYAKGA